MRRRLTPRRPFSAAGYVRLRDCLPNLPTETCFRGLFHGPHGSKPFALALYRSKAWQ
ncbi:hypothetical protein AGR1A_Cc20597 [Agrobacterium fabacearum CFBP 5771]|nr:hypothetical protein AGR1A_Cc20597 [Agrobacterium fabacearum CFBP 5771]